MPSWITSPRSYKTPRTVTGRQSWRSYLRPSPLQVTVEEALSCSYLLWTVMGVQLGQHKAAGVLNSWDEESWLMVLMEWEKKKNQVEGHQDHLWALCSQEVTKGMQVLDRRPRFHSTLSYGSALGDFSHSGKRRMGCTLLWAPRGKMT